MKIAKIETPVNENFKYSEIYIKSPIRYRIVKPIGTGKFMPIMGWAKCRDFLKDHFIAEGDSHIYGYSPDPWLSEKRRRYVWVEFTHISMKQTERNPLSPLLMEYLIEPSYKTEYDSFIFRIPNKPMNLWFTSAAIKLAYSDRKLDSGDSAANANRIAFNHSITKEQIDRIESRIIKILNTATHPPDAHNTVGGFNLLRHQSDLNGYVAKLRKFL